MALAIVLFLPLKTVHWTVFLTLSFDSPRFVSKNKSRTPFGFDFCYLGGDEGGRTPYLLNAIQALYQLSYTPRAKFSAIDVMVF